MIYLKNFKLLSEDNEMDIISFKKNIHNNLYPLNIFPKKEFENIEFDPITIFYGGNGSGKTTLLNIIANKLNANKRNINNKGEIFDSYVESINLYELNDIDLSSIKMISSDDVFDYLLDLRAINNNINRRKNSL